MENMSGVTVTLNVPFTVICDQHACELTAKCFDMPHAKKRRKTSVFECCRVISDGKLATVPGPTR